MAHSGRDQGRDRHQMDTSQSARSGVRTSRDRRRRGAMTRPRGARAVETVIVGAGQSGLMVSDLLRQAGREHLVLDRR
ncbi:MAG: FAD-dependent monooxygenase, partial [Candidatus Limnocylindrales bacterium]